MQNLKSVLASVGILALAFWGGTPKANAILITSNSVQVFEETFEDDVATPLPYHDPLNTGDFDPAPANTTPGTWQIFEGAPKNIQVTDSKTPVFYPDPGAVPYGVNTNYLRIVRPDGSVNNAVANTGSIMAGATLHSEFYLYMPTLNNTNGTAISTAPFRANLVLAQSLAGSGDAAANQDWISVFINHSQGAFGDLSILTQTNTGLYADSGIDVTADKWQLWKIDYVIGANTYLLTVDGQSAVLNVNDAATSTYIGHMIFRGAGNDTRWYIDDVVPEPSTVMLFGVGGIVMWGWKKRRGFPSRS